MWQSSISIANEYPSAVEQLTKSLEQIQGLYCAQARTATRTIYQIACKDGDLLYVKSLVDNAVCDCILTRFKFRFLNAAAEGARRTPALCALMSSLLYYDSERERTVILAALDELYEYSVEGVVYFRLKALVEAWREVADMTRSLLHTEYTDADLYSVALYMLGSREGDVSLFISDAKDLLITNANEGNMVEIVPLYDDPVLDAIHTIIAQGAKEVIVSGKQIDRRLLEALENLVRIKVL